MIYPTPNALGFPIPLLIPSLDIFPHLSFWPRLRATRLRLKKLDASYMMEIKRIVSDGEFTKFVATTISNLFTYEAETLKGSCEPFFYLQLFFLLPDAFGSGTAQVGTPSLGKTKTCSIIQAAIMPMPTSRSCTIVSSRSCWPYLLLQPCPLAS